MEIRHHLQDQLRRLKMPGLVSALDLRLAEARENNLGHLEFFSLLVQDELVSLEEHMLARRLKAAGFGVEKTFEDFDFHFNAQALPASTPCAAWQPATSSKRNRISSWPVRLASGKLM